MSRSASESKIRELNRQLEKEQAAHAETRRLLQTENLRVWRLVPTLYSDLMKIYPSLRKMLHVLAEAADNADPSRGAPIEDTMSVQFVHVGENASTSHTEAAVSTHARARNHVMNFDKELESKAHHWAQAIGAAEWEYHPPEGLCEECGKELLQTDVGRRRQFCSDRCRKRASRKVEA